MLCCLLCLLGNFPDPPHSQHNEGEDEKEVHAADEVLVDPHHPQVAGPCTQGVDPAVDGVDEEGQASERAAVGRRFQPGGAEDRGACRGGASGIVCSCSSVGGALGLGSAILACSAHTTPQEEPLPLSASAGLVRFLFMTHTPPLDGGAT